MTTKKQIKATKTATCMKCLCALGNLSAPKVSNINIIPKIPGINAVQLVPNSIFSFGFGLGQAMSHKLILMEGLIQKLGQSMVL